MVSIALDFPVTDATAGMPAALSAMAGPWPSVKITGSSIGMPASVASPPWRWDDEMPCGLSAGLHDHRPPLET